MAEGRNTNFELLRLFGVFSILYMHAFGSFIDKLTGGNEIYMLLENSIFNTGVACLMLISGYFGIRRDYGKLVRMDMEFLFYSLASLAIIIRGGGELSRFEFFSYLFPIISRRNWFVSCYVWLMLLSPFINMIPEKLEKRNFLRLLGTLFMLFSLVPTLFYYEITMDGGKGIVNLFILYLIGRYIRMHVTSGGRRKQLLLFVGSVMVTWVLNIVGSRIGMVLIFSRDCSALIIISSILLFLVFREIKISSRLINIVARNSFAILMGENLLKLVLSKLDTKQLLLPDSYIDRWYLALITVAYVLCIMAVGVVINELRRKVFGRVEAVVSELVMNKARSYKKALTIIIVHKLTELR